MAQIIIADVDVYDPGISGTRTLRFATQSYTTRPTDTPANTFYDGRIQQPANISRSCFSDAKTTGRTQIGYGDMVLVNNDGALDGLMAYSFAGRAITIKLGVVLPNSNGVVSWVTVIKGTMEQAEFSWQKVTIRVRDRQQDLAKPLQQIRYAGNNSLPTGLEGVAGDLKGKPKPLIFGKVFNVAPPQVNTDKRIYQIHSGTALSAITAVYDRGNALAFGSAYSSQSDMESTPPSAGQYRLWIDSTAGAFIRLGSTPTGTVTVDAYQGDTTASRTVGQIFKQILLASGLSTSDIFLTDIAALDAVAPYETGIYAPHDQDITPLQLLDELCSSVGAWYGTDAAGIFRIGQIALPTGTPVGVITATDILKIERVASRDPGVGVPSWKVKIGYQRLYNVQNDLTAAVSDARKSYLSDEYRRAESTDAAVKTANLTSPELEFDTQLTTESDAIAEAARRLTIYKTRRDMYQVTIRVDASLAAILDLGKIVTLQINRFGMNTGKQFLIIGVRTNMRGYQFDLTLWG